MPRFIRGCAGLLVLPFNFFSEAAAQDVNNDGRFECVDAGLIGMAVRNQSPDLFDALDLESAREELAAGVEPTNSAVPEPASFVTTLLGCALFWKRRRR